MIKIAFFILLFPSFSVLAATTEQGCQIGETMENTEGGTVKWSGGCPGGKATGKGTLQWFDDGELAQTYEGELKNGRKDGKGTWQITDTSVRYEGEWAMNAMEGRGLYTDENGIRYDGKFYNGKKHGSFLIINASGETREARFENDELIPGIYDFSGLSYEDASTGCRLWNNDPYGIVTVKWSGECLNRDATGRGIAEWYYNGKLFSRYDGEYRKGKRQGKGSITWDDGARYTGDWNDNVRTGKGIFVWSDGSRYEGNFINNKLEGFGELIIPRSAYEEEKQPPNYPNYTKLGNWIRDNYVQRGYFVNDSLYEVCPSEKSCKPVIDDLRVQKAFEKRMHRY